MKPPRAGPGALIFVAALLLRSGWVLFRWSTTGAALEYPDEELHWQLASNLVREGTLISDDGRYAARMPLYPLFLACFAWLGQVGILVARLAQALLGAATAWVGYRFAHAALGHRAAIVAGVLLCLDPYAIFFANLLLSETLFTLLAVAVTTCAWVLATRATGTGSGPVLGVALLGAAAILTRPSAAGWIPLLWMVLWLLDTKRSRATRRVGICAALLAIALLPWGLRNRALLGTFAWLSTNGGVTLYDAQGPQAEGGSNQAFLQQMPELAGLDEVERDRRLRRMAVEQMRHDPWKVLRLAWVKFRRTWSLIPNVADHRTGLTAGVSALFTAGSLILAAAGLWRTCASKSARSPGKTKLRRLQLFVWLPVVYFTLLHCVFIGSLRYRVPLMPFIGLAAAAAFAQTRPLSTAAPRPRLRTRPRGARSRPAGFPRRGTSGQQAGLHSTSTSTGIWTPHRLGRSERRSPALE